MHVFTGRSLLTSLRFSRACLAAAPVGCGRACGYRFVVCKYGLIYRMYTCVRITRGEMICAHDVPQNPKKSSQLVFEYSRRPPSRFCVLRTGAERAGLGEGGDIHTRTRLGFGFK